MIGRKFCVKHAGFGGTFDVIYTITKYNTCYTTPDCNYNRFFAEATIGKVKPIYQRLDLYFILTIDNILYYESQNDR